MRALTELVDAQAAFFQSAASHVSKLQNFVHEKNGGVSTSASFPRRNSANQSVPVSDILKVNQKIDETRDGHRAGFPGPAISKPWVF